MTIIDISPGISPQTAVFPGDTKVSSTQNWTMSPDCPVNVSAFTMSTHAGAHADAPLHYDANGTPIDQLALAPYLGKCVVLDVSNGTGPITVSEVKDAAKNAGTDLPGRVLLRTYKTAPRDWDPDFRPIGAQTIDFLANSNVILIGVDTQSLDPATSKTMEAHNAVRRANMRILECLVLDHVTPGVYELIALPLKLEGLDAAPVRAVLRKYP